MLPSFYINLSQEGINWILDVTPIVMVSCQILNKSMPFLRARIRKKFLMFESNTVSIMKSFYLYFPIQVLAFILG